MSETTDLKKENLSIQEGVVVHMGIIKLKTLYTTICSETLQKRVVLAKIYGDGKIREKWDMPMYMLYEKAGKNDPVTLNIRKDSDERFTVEPLIKIGQIYRHHRGRRFKIIDIVVCPVTLQSRVIYMEYSKDNATTGEKWSRPLQMFFDKVQNSNAYSKDDSAELRDRFILEVDI